MHPFRCVAPAAGTLELRFADGAVCEVRAWPSPGAAWLRVPLRPRRNPDVGLDVTRFRMWLRCEEPQLTTWLPTAAIHRTQAQRQLALLDESGGARDHETRAVVRLIEAIPVDVRRQLATLPEPTRQYRLLCALAQIPEATAAVERRPYLAALLADRWEPDNADALRGLLEHNGAAHVPGDVAVTDRVRSEHRELLRAVQSVPRRRAWLNRLPRANGGVLRVLAETPEEALAVLHGRMLVELAGLHEAPSAHAAEMLLLCVERLRTLDRPLAQLGALPNLDEVFRLARELGDLVITQSRRAES